VQKELSEYLIQFSFKLLQALLEDEDADDKSKDGDDDSDGSSDDSGSVADAEKASKGSTSSSTGSDKKSNTKSGSGSGKKSTPPPPPKKPAGPVIRITAPNQADTKIDHICMLLEEVMEQAATAFEAYSTGRQQVLLAPEMFILLDNIQLLNRELTNITNFLYGISVGAVTRLTL